MLYHEVLYLTYVYFLKLYFENHNLYFEKLLCWNVLNFEISTLPLEMNGRKRSKSPQKWLSVSIATVAPHPMAIKSFAAYFTSIISLTQRIMYIHCIYYALPINLFCQILESILLSRSFFTLCFALSFCGVLNPSVRVRGKGDRRSQQTNSKKFADNFTLISLVIFQRNFTHEFNLLTEHLTIYIIVCIVFNEFTVL